MDVGLKDDQYFFQTYVTLFKDNIHIFILFLHLFVTESLFTWFAHKLTTYVSCSCLFLCDNVFVFCSKRKRK